MNSRACNINEPSSSRSAEDHGFEKGYFGECCVIGLQQYHVLSKKMKAIGVLLWSYIK